MTVTETKKRDKVETEFSFGNVRAEFLFMRRKLVTKPLNSGNNGKRGLNRGRRCITEVEVGEFCFFKLYFNNIKIEKTKKLKQEKDNSFVNSHSKSFALYSATVKNIRGSLKKETILNTNRISDKIGRIIM